MPKKNFQNNFSPKIDKLFEEAEQGNTKSMIEILVKSGRFSCSDDELKNFLEEVLPSHDS